MWNVHGVIVCLAFATSSCGLLLARPDSARISGTVTSADGQPVSHARVVLLDDERWVRADEFGRYQVRGLRPGVHTIAALAEECAVAVGSVRLDRASHVQVNLVLARWTAASFAARFDAVAEPAWTEGAATRVFTQERIRRSGTGNVLEFLAREAPDAAQVVSGQAGAGGMLRGRAATLRGESQQPLIIIDGVPLALPASPAAAARALRDIPLIDARRIEILRGAAASALYGSQGAAGAIRVTTAGAATSLVVVPAALCPAASRVRKKEGGSETKPPPQISDDPQSTSDSGSTAVPRD